MIRSRFGLVAAGLLLVGVSRANADVLYTLNDTTNGVSATAHIKAVAGGIQITVTNTESNTANAGKAISQLQLTVGGGLSLPTAFSELKGTLTDFSNPTSSLDAAPPTSSEHWKFTTSGASTVNLATVGPNAYGGQPNHLIVADGSTPNASLTNTHTPSFIGAVDFFLATASVPADITLANITSFKFAFGTQPEIPLESGTGSYNPSTNPQVDVVPEPATLTLLCIGSA
jgi:hypothetical protein